MQAANETITYRDEKISGSLRMSFEEFLDWYDEDTWAEWVNGEVIVLSPASGTHQLILGFLLYIIGTFVRRRDVGSVLFAPFLMRMTSVSSVRAPDIIFTSKARLDRMTEYYLDGPADLVIEIVCPETRGRDRGNKYYEYEQAGVREYWLIDPLRRRAEFHSLDDNGIYRSIPVGEDGIYRSVVLDGFLIRVDSLWEDPRPDPIEVLREMNV